MYSPDYLHCIGCLWITKIPELACCVRETSQSLSDLIFAVIDAVQMPPGYHLKLYTLSHRKHKEAEQFYRRPMLMHRSYLSASRAKMLHGVVKVGRDLWKSPGPPTSAQAGPESSFPRTMCR